MEKIAETSVETDTPIEINLSRIEKAYNKPQSEFFKLAAEYGCKAIIGIDAHTPEALLQKEKLEKAIELADKYSLNLIEKLELKPPRLALPCKTKILQKQS